MRLLLILSMQLGLAAPLALFVPPPPSGGTVEAAPPSAGPDCGEQVCLYAESGASGQWKAGSKMSRKARRKDAKKNRKRKALGLSVVVREARGSAFIDGRYVPEGGLEIKPGRHELEVRDGSTVITLGVVTVPRKAGSLTVEVYANRG